jgi:hypothetical protein
MKKTILFLVAISMIALVSCTKEGPAGPQGIPGSSGTNGTNGNANVYYSNWTTLSTPWADTTIDGSLLKYNYELAPMLTQQNLDSAAILAYFRYVTGSIVPLPYTSYAGGTANAMSYIPALGKMYYTRFTFDNTGSVGVSGALEYRYVIIPGGVTSKSMLSSMPYDELCAYYKIPK